MSRHQFEHLTSLQHAASRSLTYHDPALSEAIMHHCAVRCASATAPTDKLVGLYVKAEIKAKNQLLRMPVGDLEGVAVRARYLRALSRSDEWDKDAGTIAALVDGLASLGGAP